MVHSNILLCMWNCKFKPRKEFNEETVPLQSSADFTRIALLFPRLRLAWAFMLLAARHGIPYSLGNGVETAGMYSQQYCPQTIYTITRYYCISCNIVNRINFSDAVPAYEHSPLVIFPFSLSDGLNNNCNN